MKSGFSRLDRKLDQLIDGRAQPSQLAPPPPES
jgi:hypothetical protein